MKIRVRLGIGLGVVRVGVTAFMRCGAKTKETRQVNSS